MSDNFVPTSDLYKVKFYVLDEEENDIDSMVEIKNKELFRNNKPYDRGVYDSKMGTTDHSYHCGTCFHSKTECSGHFGKIVLPYPMISPLFKKEVLKWLKVICFKCGECIVNIKNKNIEKTQILNECVKLSRTSTQKNIRCINCNELHPVVQKDPKDHLKITIKINETERRLYNNEIEDIFSKISDSTVINLGKELTSHPKRFVLRTIRAPPVTIRPDIKKIKGGRSNNNDLTTILKNIVNLLEKIPTILDDELIKKHIIQLDNIEMHYFNLIKDTPAGNTNKLQTNTGLSLVSISSRFAKKSGRIRKNILGKRTTYMGRSVITGDNSIKIDEVGVPLSIAKNIQIPETLQYYNKQRLMTYFLNKDKQYPGCSKIIKKSNGSEYYVGAINDDFVLEEGDIVYRDIIDGDIVAMNRAPSLLYSSISGHTVKIMEKGDTLRLSVNVADTLYGGDFDGDAMMIIFPHSIQARNECKNLSGMQRWCISLKNGSPSIGVYHDGLIGIFEFTKNDVNVNKYNSMRLLSNNNMIYKNFMLEKNNYNSRELLSKLLPPINYIKKAGFYNSDYSDFIKYKEDEIKVEISRGNIVKGRIDKKSIGQGVDGSIFHIIHNEYGSEIALDTIYNIQQMTTIYLMHKGCTINYDDITISKNALKKVHEQTESILFEAKQITNNLLNGKIIPPLGLTVKEYYEQQQLANLNLGDDFLKPVFEDIDTEKNNLFKLIISGSKGKLTNLLQISSSIGQTSIGGERMFKLFDYERTCPYYPRFNESPQNRGFVTESYTSGVDMLSFIFQSMEARYSIINKALSTSITGEQNRKSIKNLESLVVDNTRKVIFNNKIVQYIYGSDGVDTRFNEIVMFNTVLLSYEKFEKSYKATFNDIDKIFHNKNIQKILDDEFEQLKNDRMMYRETYLKIEKQNTKNKLLTNTRKMPINIYRIIEDVLFNYKDIISKQKYTINPADIYEKINKLCKNIQYGHYNEIQMIKNMKIPSYVQFSFTLVNILIRSNLNIKNIITKNINEDILDIIINRIINTFNKSLISYGTPIGIITAQSISEPMTQYVLDSHHRTGASGTKTDFLVRMKEILGAKDTSKMKAPNMILYINDKYKNDTFKTQEIANHIEMMSLNLFINSYQIFFESYKNIIHPNYVDEINIINMFEKHNPNLKIPNDLIKWCVRFEFNKEKLIEKNMKFETICFKLHDLFPNLFVINTAENADKIIMRIYFKQNHFKKNAEVNLAMIESFVTETLLTSIIRGVDNILSTSCASKIARTIINEDDSVDKVSESVIITEGTNLKEIFQNMYINPYLSQSDSIIEIYELLGIEAARNKIIIELMNMMPASDQKHYNLYADLMTSTGMVTSIDKTGIENREKNNILLNLGNSHPLQGLETAAINSSESICNGSLTPSLMVGQMPTICSSFNKIVLNESFIQQNINDINSQLNDL
jgi:DNA-directed RNA polymerase beta' subunit